MSDLTKNKAANALVWAALFAFWLHSLHCCRAHAPNEAEPCVFVLHCSPLFSDASDLLPRCFHAARDCASSGDSSKRRPIFAPFLFARNVETRSPALGFNRGAQKSTCANACPISPFSAKKNGFERRVLSLSATFGTVSLNDLRLIAVAAFSSRLTNACSTPLYLRLRKLIN